MFYCPVELQNHQYSSSMFGFGFRPNLLLDAGLWTQGGRSELPFDPTFSDLGSTH